MDFKGIRTGIQEGISTGLTKLHGALFSAPDLDESAKKFTHAMQGQTYTPGIGVEGEFDMNSDSGRDYIADTRQKLLSAMQRYDKAHGHRGEMRSADDILSEDHGIDVDGVIIDAQKEQAIARAPSDDVDHDEFRM